MDERFNKGLEEYIKEREKTLAEEGKDFIREDIVKEYVQIDYETRVKEKYPIIEKLILKRVFCNKLMIDRSSIGISLSADMSVDIRKEEEDGYIISLEAVEYVFNKLIENELIEENVNGKTYSFIEIVLTPKGKAEVLEKGYIGIQEAISYTDYIYDKSIEHTNTSFQKLNELSKELDSKQKKFDTQILKQQEKIRNFNSNILTIMGILIAAFAIIGFNIGGIKFLVGDKEVLMLWKYIGGIVAINISMIMSLYFLFYLINRVVNTESNEEDSSCEKKKGFNIFNGSVVFIIFLIFIGAVIGCFYLRSKGM